MSFLQKLTGQVPTEIGLLSKLDSLSLTENKFRSLPSEIGLLTSLRTLWLDGNQLTSPVAPEIWDLKSNGVLADMSLAGNSQLSGTVPKDVCELDTLVFDCTDIFCGCNCSCERD